jgi:hypothetical protein
VMRLLLALSMGFLASFALAADRVDPVLQS